MRSRGRGADVGRSFLAMATAVAVATVLLLALEQDVPGLASLERDAYAARLAQRYELAPVQHAAVVGIDQRSVDHIGSWPWPRDVSAALISKLTDAGARVIAFDVVFALPRVDLPHPASLASLFPGLGLEGLKPPYMHDAKAQVARFLDDAEQRLAEAGGEPLVLFQAHVPGAARRRKEGRKIHRGKEDPPGT